jgi:hypothetical protein
MKTASVPVGIGEPRAERALGGVGFDWAMVAACAWFQIGAYLDRSTRVRTPT